MMKLLSSTILVIALLLTGQSYGKSAPIVLVMQPEGKIEYSKDGTKWKKIRRNKFLFEGSQIKTLTGSAKIINQLTGQIQTIGANTNVKITANGAELIDGDLSAPTASGGNLLKGIQNKFAKAQRYTTVRRGTHKSDEVVLKTIRNVTLSKDHPELVWENFGNDYWYRLKINEQVIDLPAKAANDEFYRYKVDAMSPGSHEFSVVLMKGDDVVYEPRKPSNFYWQSDEDVASLQSELKKIAETIPNDKILQGSVLEDRGLIIAAMEQYRAYFSENPDDFEMRPMLIKTYHDLKLKALKTKEVSMYNEWLDNEE